jgi:Family of unknown function (DUF6165)
MYRPWGPHTASVRSGRGFGDDEALTRIGGNEVSDMTDLSVESVIRSANDLLERIRNLDQMTAPGAASDPILVEIDAGDLIDRVTMLRIKSERIADPGKRANVMSQLVALESARSNLLRLFPALAAVEAELKEINNALWDVENDIRQCETCSDFGPRFIDLARTVYKNNDRRADLKRKVNALTGSRIVEEKSYEGT